MVKRVLVVSPGPSFMPAGRGASQCSQPAATKIISTTNGSSTPTMNAIMTMVRSHFMEHARAFLFDLVEEGLCDRLDDREYCDRDLGIAHHLLDCAGERDDRRLILEAGPKIN